MLKRIFQQFEQPKQPIDPLQALYTERATAMAGVERFSKFDIDVADANNELLSAKAALTDFESTERASLVAWSNSDEPEPPARDLARHTDLIHTIEAAERDLRAAQTRQKAIEPARAQALEILAGVQLKLDQHRADTIAAEALREVDELAEIFSDALRHYAKIIGCREALFQHGDSLNGGKFGANPNHRMTERGQAFISAGARLSNIPAFTNIQPNNAAIQNEISAWRAKIRG